MKPYIVLATYKPSVWNAKKIGLDLTAITKKVGLKPHVDPAHGPLPLKGKNWVSVPLHAEVRRRTFNTTQAESFHQDGDTTEGAKMDCGMVLWASNSPTEIKYGSEILTPNPYELIIFRNKSVSHRRPAGVPKKRWVFRQRVSSPNGKFLNLA
jgi:hypothetical protein